MFLLMITICATAAMDNCQVHRVGKPVATIAICERSKKDTILVLGTGPDQNYRLDCVPEKEA